MGSVLIKGGRVWDGERFFIRDVLTENKQIIKIDQNISEKADLIFDASGKIVSPGFVDIHTHLKGISEDQLGVSAELSSIPFGVTAAADASGLCGDKEIMKYILLKCRVFVYVDIRQNKAYFDKAEVMLEKYKGMVAGLKLYYDKSTVVDCEPLLQAVEFAEGHGLRVMVHSSNSPVPMKELLNILRKGDIITHSYHGGIHHAGEDNYECLKKAKERGVIIDVGFAGHVHTDFGILKEALQCGAVPSTISTDITKWSAYKRGGKYGMTMCMSIARYLGMKEEEIFRAVTSTPADVLGMGNECGRLEAGRLADIAVIEYADEGFSLTDAAHNQVFSKHGYRCVMTMVDGEIVYVK